MITFSSGQTLPILSGQIARDVTVLFDGMLVVLPTGTASATIDSGGQEVVVSAGTARGTTVNAGTKTLISGGTATAATVNSGGVDVVDLGGKASRRPTSPCWASTRPPSSPRRAMVTAAL